MTQQVIFFFHDDFFQPNVLSKLSARDPCTAEYTQFILFFFALSTEADICFDLPCQELVMLRFGFIDFDRFRFDFLINNSISIRFCFDFFTICTPLLTQLDSCVAAWERQCCGAGHPRSYPPTAAVLPSSSG